MPAISPASPINCRGGGSRGPSTVGLRISIAVAALLTAPPDSESPEIWRYPKKIEQENNFIQKYIKLRHKVTACCWNDKDGKWTVTVQDLTASEEFHDKVDFVINGGGVLNKWKWPEVAGLQSFRGDLLHSAAYPEEYDLKGKRVALIGAGSSAVQILPNIYADVSKVYTWVRTPIWIAAAFAQGFAGENGGNFIYSEAQQDLFNEPDRYLRYSKMIEDELNQRYSFIINGSEAQKEARAYSTQLMTDALKDRPELLSAIMPKDFYVGCRRRESLFRAVPLSLTSMPSYSWQWLSRGIDW